MANSDSKLTSDIRKWSKSTKTDFKNAISKQKIGYTGALYRSLNYQLAYAYGDVEKISFKFLRYGVYVELGVGRGYPIESVRNNRLLSQGGRVPKEWYNPTLDQQMPELANTVSEHKADAVIRTFKIGERANGK